MRVQDVLPVGANGEFFTKLGIFFTPAPVAEKRASHAMWLREQRRRLHRIGPATVKIVLREIILSAIAVANSCI